MASKIACIADGYYPSSMSQAKDLTDGGRTCYGTSNYSITQPSYKRYINTTFEYNNTFGDDSKWYGTNKHSERKFEPDDANQFFKAKGVKASWTCNSSSASNIIIEIGLQCQYSYTAKNFNTRDRATLMRNVMGMSFVWSSGGGDANLGLVPYIEKVGLVYTTQNSTPNTSCGKYILACNFHKDGSKLQKYPDFEPIERNTTMTFSQASDNWYVIQNLQLIHVGYIFQLWTPQSQFFRPINQFINLSHLRPVVCSHKKWGSSGPNSKASQLYNIEVGSNIADYCSGKVGFSL